MGIVNILVNEIIAKIYTLVIPDRRSWSAVNFSVWRGAFSSCVVASFLQSFLLILSSDHSSGGHSGTRNWFIFSFKPLLLQFFSSLCPITQYYAVYIANRYSHAVKKTYCGLERAYCGYTYWRRKRRCDFLIQNILDWKFSHRRQRANFLHGGNASPRLHWQQLERQNSSLFISNYSVNISDSRSLELSNLMEPPGRVMTVNGGKFA